MVVFAVHPVTPQGTVTLPSSTTAVIVIPARYDSIRFPGKPLADIAGRPMIEHVYRRAAAVSRATSVLVATDDKRIQEAVLRFGGDVRLTEQMHRNGTERLAEVARDLKCDLVVNVQGDEPLVDPVAINLALSAFEHQPKLRMSTLRTPLTNASDLSNPNVVKVVVDQQDFALYFSRGPIPCGDPTNATLGRPSRASKHIGLYVYRREFLLHLATLEPTPLEQAESLEQLRALEHGFRIKTLETAHDPIGVDTPDDLERVRRIVRAGAFQ